MSATASAAGFRHEALFYRDGLDGFAREVSPLVAGTLGAGGTVAVAAPADRLARLRAEVGEDDRLQLLDMARVGANPARIIPAWRELADRALESGAPFLGVGEPVWVGRSEDELDECHHHEALIDVAFGEDPAWRLVCPYDADGLDPSVLACARRTHAVIVGGESGAAGGAGELATLERPLPPAPPDAAVLTYARRNLREVHALVRREAAAAGLSEERAADLLLAVAELASNSIRHGGGQGTLRVWRRDGAVVCQTSDAGWIADPMVGRRRPAGSEPSGRGMWIVQQVSDLVQIRSSAHGTTVRVTVG